MADPFEKHRVPEVTSQLGRVEPSDRPSSKPKDVPVFNCIVYVSNQADGRVQARVANLSELACTASTEREALGKIVSAFKQRIVELTQSGTPIPWIEPASPIEPKERKRLIAVHL
jgi:hypothetical protein